MKTQNIRVLVLSHNSFSESSNNGKTLESFFYHFNKNNLAQIFLHEDIPDYSFCSNYFCISDKEVLNFFMRKGKAKIGHVPSKELRVDNFSKSKRGSFAKNVITKGFKKRIPFFTFVREFLWSIAPWDNSQLNEWIKEFDPDLLFYQGSNCSFVYRIASTICERYSIPMVLELTDDYTYINYFSLFDIINKRKYARSLEKAIDTAKCIIANSPEMVSEYQKRFGGTNYRFLMNSPQIFPEKHVEKKAGNVFLYAGNLSLRRWKVLLLLGEVLDDLNRTIDDTSQYVLKIHSLQIDSNVMKAFDKIESIEFGGPLGRDALNDVISNAKYLVHVEAFDKKMKKITRLSISTKIAEYLSSNKCILAIGPSDVASMKYLINNKAAYICASPNRSEIKDTVLSMLKDDYNRDEIISNAFELYNMNHNAKNVSILIDKIFTEAVL